MSNGASSPGQAPKLPVIGTIIVAYRFVFRHAGPFLAAAVIPFIVAMATDLRGLLAARENGMPYLAELLWWILPSIAVIPFSTQCQRYFLDPTPANRPRFGFPWSRRETLFALHAMGLFVLMMVLSIFTLPVTNLLPAGTASSARGALGIVFTAVIFILMIYIVARLMLVLPAAAIGRPLSWLEAWRRASDHGVGLALIIFLTPLPWLVPSVISLIAGPETAEFWRFLVTTAIIEACSLASIATVLVALAAAYRWIMGGSGTVTPAADA